ncbi:Ferric reduction oxidase 5-like protein [Drosera capensis]
MSKYLGVGDDVTSYESWIFVALGLISLSFSSDTLVLDLQFQTFNQVKLQEWSLEALSRRSKASQSSKPIVPKAFTPSPSSSHPSSSHISITKDPSQHIKLWFMQGYSFSTAVHYLYGNHFLIRSDLELLKHLLEQRFKGKLYVSSVAAIRPKMIVALHDSPEGGHPGILASIKGSLHYSTGLGHNMLVIVAGGSGIITPFISMIRELIHLKTELKWKIPKLLLITAFKKSSDLSMLDLLLPISGVPADIWNLELQIEAYVTRDKEQPTKENMKKIETVGFKATASDVPISPILGKNGWLWLAAIIASSFVAFLLFVGILTRFYIYPIHRNINKILSSSTRSVLNILLICICMAGTSSLAVNWTKKRNTLEMTQITNMEGMTPRKTPESWASNGDRELEILTNLSSKLPKSTMVNDLTSRSCYLIVRDQASEY